jgi:8-oxo-dGTP pyrophosphatase MutT (NUDIX family)
MYLSLGAMFTIDGIRFLLVPTRSGIRGVRVLVVRENQVLLVTHWHAPWVWLLPGGGVDKGESPQDAAVREVVEETGLRIRSLGGLVGTYRGRWGARDKVAVYFARDFDGSLALAPSLEIMGRSWFDMDHLPDEIAKSSLKRIQAFRAGVRDERGAW